MKKIGKILYMVAAGGLMLCGCSQEEAPVKLPDVKDRRITFHASMPEITTKASEIVKDMDYFHVTAFNGSDNSLVDDENGILKYYIENQHLKKDNGQWISPEEADCCDPVECLWPQPGHESDLLHFFAYYPELNEGAELENATKVDESGTEIGYKLNRFKVAENIADQVDFVTAYTTGTMDDNLFSGITLPFNHQLSRIEVKAKSAHKSCDIEIAGVSIGSAYMTGDFVFQNSTEEGKEFGSWTEKTKGNATYIFREGDAIITAGADPVSIMGNKIDDDNENCAMLIPSESAAWAYSTDQTNSNGGLYLNVLLRVIDKTNTPGKGTQQYPYYDNSQGLNALSIPRVYIAVKTDGKTVSRRLYKSGDSYFSDAACEVAYTLRSDEMVKEFGWAAVPISGSWEPGKIYTYTLDYTYGVGVHGPETPPYVGEGEEKNILKPGDPIISDRVGVSLGFKDWTKGGTTGVPVPGN